MRPVPPLLAIAEGRRARRRRVKIPAPKELVLHMAVADVLRRFARPDWRWSHFPSGELRDKRTAGKLKAMGLQPGWPDLLLIDPVGVMHALELKRQGETLTDEQKDFEAWCVEHGVPHAVAQTSDAALKVLSLWDVLTIKPAARGNGWELASLRERAEATS